MEVTRMSIVEFRKAGFLQELNRQFLHPLGLALEVVQDEETGEERLGGIWDYRGDKEGILFDGFTNEEIERAISVARFQAQKAIQRLEVLGFIIQPLMRVNSSNPRDEHLAMAGETVGIRERFSNGMRWPGDPAGGAENNANCQCSVEFGK